MISVMIAGVERYKDLINSTLSISRALTYQIDTCTLSIAGIQPTEGQEVIINDSGTRMFAGIITKSDLIDEKFGIWGIDCDDYTNLLDQKLVVETYSNLSASAIFLDIANKYTTGFTVAGVRLNAPVIERILFDYVTVSEAFKQLCEYVGWQWQPSYTKDLEFYRAETVMVPAPMELVAGSQFYNHRHTIDTQNLRNRVFVRGGTFLSDFFTYSIRADGSARIWILPHNPSEISMWVNEIPQTVGIENVHKEPDFNYMMNYQKKYIRASVGTPTISAGTTIAWTYKYPVDVITVVDDIDSQKAIVSVQGGDGAYEHAIVDTSIMTIEAAEALAQEDINKHSNPKIKGSFLTEVSGWNAGQMLSINLADRGIVNQYFIQGVKIDLYAGRWTYTIEYGGRLIGIADFLKNLVSNQQKKDLTETQILNKLIYGTHRIGTIDELTTTSRSPLFICGQLDAICGEVIAWI